MDPLRSETCWSTFKCFIILIVSTYYILCISWIIKCLIIIDARCKHEDGNEFPEFCKMCGISLLPEELLASDEGVCSMDSVFHSRSSSSLS